MVFLNFSFYLKSTSRKVKLLTKNRKMISLISKASAFVARQQLQLIKVQSMLKSYQTISPLLIQKANLSISKCNQNNAKADADLHKFLIEEIKSEKEISQAPKNGKSIPGFELKENGADILLKRKFQNEEITIKFNVNASVDDGSSELNENAQEKPDEIVATMKAKPDFVVEIRKSKELALVFNCGFLEDAEEAEQSEKTDLFEIQNFYLLENGLTINSELSDSIYMGDGSLIDGQFYDLLMDYLDERGIGFEFAENLVDFATYHEHEQYINLLNKIKGFITNKI